MAHLWLKNVTKKYTSTFGSSVAKKKWVVYDHCFGNKYTTTIYFSNVIFDAVSLLCGALDSPKRKVFRIISFHHAEN